MHKFLVVFGVYMLAMCGSVHAQEAGSTLGLETALGYSVSFRVVDELMGVVDAAHAYYQVEGSWPADSTALVQFAQADTSSKRTVGLQKYERLNLYTIGAGQLQIVFQLAPYESAIEEEGGEAIPLSIRRAAGAIGMEPIARDSSRVIIHMDELKYAGGPDLSVEGDLGGAEMEFEYVGTDE